MNGKLTYLLASPGQFWKSHIATDIWWSRMAIGGLPADATPPHVSLDIYYGMSIGSHVASFKKRWDWPSSGEELGYFTCQLTLYSLVVRGNGNWHLWNTPETAPKHLDNFKYVNYEVSDVSKVYYVILLLMLIFTDLLEHLSPIATDI